MWIETEEFLFGGKVDAVIDRGQRQGDADGGDPQNIIGMLIVVGESKY